MEENPRSSFIPKKVPATRTTVRRSRRRLSVISLIATVVLVASVVLAGGTFFYRDYVSGRLVEQKNALAAERERFSESDIASVRELDRRIEAAKYRIDNHLSISSVLRAIELNTKQSVQFTTFNLERRPSGNLTITVSGVTSDFEKVALQAEQFDDAETLSSFHFTDISNTIAGEEEGGSEEEVQFGVTTDITKSDVLYKIEVVSDGVFDEEEDIIEEDTNGLTEDENQSNE